MTRAPAPLAYDEEDVRVLALTVYGEAREDTLEGKVAVAWVARNRSSDRRWPNQVRKVCRQRRQFGCWDPLEGRTWPMAKADLSADQAYRECFAVAAGVLAGLFRDRTDGATHFHAARIRKPSWARGRGIARAIGGQVFYNDIV